MKLDEIYSGLETAGLTDVIAGIKNHISGLNSESAGHRKRAEDYASERDSFKNQFETVKNGGSLEMLTLKTRLETLEKTVTEQDKLLIETQVKTTLKEKLTPLFDSASDLLALTATRDNLAVIDDLGKISLKFGDKVFDIDDINGLKMLGSRYGVSEMATVSKGKPAPVNGNGNADIDKFKAMNQTELMKYAKQGATQENEVLSFMQQNK